MAAIHVPGIGGGFDGRAAEAGSVEDFGGIAEHEASCHALSVGLAGCVAPQRPFSPVLFGVEDSAAPMSVGEIRAGFQDGGDDGTVPVAPQSRGQIRGGAKGEILRQSCKGFAGPQRRVEGEN
jgi:hypothetical protein